MTTENPSDHLESFFENVESTRTNNTTQSRTQRGEEKRNGVTDEMALRQVATCYLRSAAQRAISTIDRSHLTMAEPCDINGIAYSLDYAVNNVLQILNTIPYPSREEIDNAWERFRRITEKLEELETRVRNQEI